MTRQQSMDRCSKNVLDVLVVGGGITGAGMAREAAWYGFNTLLIEKTDFGAGTSSRSSKLLHGGLRYLEHYEFGLVFEAVRERMAGYRIAPHLVKPLPFLFPQFTTDRPGMNVMSVGLWLYDMMAGFQTFGLHQRYSKQEFADAAPGIRTDDLVGGFRYYDAQTNDARLTYEAILDARSLGAETLNQVSLVSAKRLGDLWACTLKCELTQKEFEVQTRTVAVAAGPWLDAVAPMFGTEERQYMRPTKGVHLLVRKERFPLKETVVILHPEDKRVMFAISDDENDCVVIGTSDTDHPDAALEPEVTLEDVEYLLEGANSLFPDLKLAAEDVYTSYAGLRPLVNEEGVSESEVSREHAVFELAQGVHAIAGGKLTTWRTMATDGLEPIVDILSRDFDLSPKRKKKSLYRRSMPGGVGLHSIEDVEALETSIVERCGSRIAAHSLVTLFGNRIREVLEFAQSLEDGRERLGSSQVLLGALMFSVHNEDVHSLDDLLRRRFRVFYQEDDQGREIARTIAPRVGRVLGWDDAEVESQIQAYEAICDHYFVRNKT